MGPRPGLADGCRRDAGGEGKTEAAVTAGVTRTADARDAPRPRACGEARQTDPVRPVHPDAVADPVRERARTARRARG